MKNFHQNLLIVLALSLCGLCVYQWYGQTLERNRIENLNHLLADKSSAIQGYTNSIAVENHQIEEMDARITDLKATVATNAEFNLAQKREISRLQLTAEELTNEIIQYTNAVTTLETKLQDLVAGVQKQNAAITELAAQRDDFVKKYNDSVKDRNAVVDKYNDLVKQIDKQSGTGNKQ